MTLFLSFKEALPKGEACPHDFHFHSRRSALAPCPVLSFPALSPRTRSFLPDVEIADYLRAAALFFFSRGWMFPGVWPKAGQVPREVGPSFNCALNYADAVSSPLSDGPRARSAAFTSLFQESGCDEAPPRRRLPGRGWWGLGGGDEEEGGKKKNTPSPRLSVKL